MVQPSHGESTAVVQIIPNLKITKKQGFLVVYSLQNFHTLLMKKKDSVQERVGTAAILTSGVCPSKIGPIGGDAAAVQ